MKKWLLLPLTILIIAVVLLLLPWGIGLLVQAKYTEMLKQFSNSDSIKFTLVSYKRHWFDADIVINVSANPQKLLKTPHVGNAPVTFKLTQHIKHGPLLSATPLHEKIHKYIGLALITSHVDPAMGTINGMSIMGFNAALVSVLSMPQVHYRSPVSNLTLDMAGTMLILENTYDLQHFEGQIHIPQLSLHTGELIQNIQNLNTKFNLIKGEGDLFLGSRSGTIDKVSWQLPGGQANIELDNIQMDTENSIANEKIAARTYLFIKKLAIDNASYGPQEIDLAVKDIDLPAFLLLRKELSNLDQTTEVSLPDVSNYMNIAALLISKGMVIDLKKLHVSTPWGNPELRMELDFLPQNETPTSLLGAIDHLSAKAHLQVPSIFLVKLLEYVQQYSNIIGIPSGTISPDDINQQIKAWIDYKWLITAGNGYITDLTYKNKQLYINDQRLEPQKLMLKKAQPNEFIEVRVPILPQTIN